MAEDASPNLHNKYFDPVGSNSLRIIPPARGQCTYASGNRYLRYLKNTVPTCLDKWMTRAMLLYRNTFHRTLLPLRAAILLGT